MSRIFDALRRSEGEQERNGSSTLPTGPELLLQAERRIASDWEAGISTTGDEPEEGGKKAGHDALKQIVGGTASELPPDTRNILSSGARQEIFNRFQQLPISLFPDSHLACITDPDSPTAESVRLLGVRLRDRRRVRPLKTVLLTSTIPKEGKSTIATNLAYALARNVEEKVLLIEGDVRLPTVLKMLGIDKKPGLIELLGGKRELGNSVYSVPDAGFFVLPAGNAPKDPLELLQSQKLASLMDQLTACFDWVVIDSPPVLPLADTSVWMRLADGILLVTRKGLTEKKQLQRGLDVLEPQKMIGALLNSSTSSLYGYYYYNSSSIS
jgi:capsular exopolysaccharide synthesis family protein